MNKRNSGGSAQANDSSTGVTPLIRAMTAFWPTGVAGHAWKCGEPFDEQGTRLMSVSHSQLVTVSDGSSLSATKLNET